VPWISILFYETACCLSTHAVFSTHSFPTGQLVAYTSTPLCTKDQPTLQHAVDVLFTRSVQRYPTIFFPAVSNGKRVGKLCEDVEGTFMRMHDFLLTRNTARYQSGVTRVRRILVSLKMTERLDQ
jgi:hypothetical protein